MSKVSKEFTQQISELLKPIKDKALRGRLKKNIIRNVQTGGAEEVNLEWLRRVVPSYRYKPTDYPAEYALFVAVCQEEFAPCESDAVCKLDELGCKLDELGYQVSLLDRMQWKVFFRGIQMVQAGALSENHNQGA